MTTPSDLLHRLYEMRGAHDYRDVAERAAAPTFVVRRALTDAVAAGLVAERRDGDRVVFELTVAGEDLVREQRGLPALARAA